MPVTEGQYRPRVQLVGMDGNAYSILGRTKKALRQAEREGLLPSGTAEQYQTEATSGNYDHLLAVTFDYVDEGEDE